MTFPLKHSFWVSAHNFRHTIYAILWLSSSPLGRSATSLRMKSSALGDSVLSPNRNLVLPSPPVVHGNVPILQSVSVSAVEAGDIAMRMRFV